MVEGLLKSHRRGGDAFQSPSVSPFRAAFAEKGKQAGSLFYDFSRLALFCIVVQTKREGRQSVGREELFVGKLSTPIVFGAIAILGAVSLAIIALQKSGVIIANPDTLVALGPLNTAPPLLALAAASSCTPTPRRPSSWSLPGAPTSGR